MEMEDHGGSERSGQTRDAAYIGREGPSHVEDMSQSLE